MSVIDPIVEDFLTEAQQDWIGLWAIEGAVEHDLHLSDNAEIKARTLDVVRGLLKRGLWPGNFGTDKKFHEWNLPDAAACLARIDNEWDISEGHSLALDAICWLYWKKN
jgi:hypothetical protein